MQPTEGQSDRVAIGVVAGTFGVAGAVRVRTFSGESDHLATLSEAHLIRGNDERRVEIAEVLPRGDHAIVTVVGVSTREAAQSLNGLEVHVDRAFAAPLREGEWYIAELIGARVTDGERTVGTVTSVIEGAQADLFEVRLDASPADESPRSSATTLLVPFMAEFVAAPRRDGDGWVVEVTNRWILDSQ